jgi:hypothetical protein
VPNGVTAVSVTAVLTWFRMAGLAVAVSAGVPTVKPAAVMVVLAAESATPRSYCRFRGFSFLFFAIILCHIMLPYLLGQPKYQLRV